ncbi:hypothetical protein [Yinghuangia soli]|uniref:Uncharacterized protein n=1 Tax=Yinghuangia soli TaxID=2908204 RepID=A0AA41PYR7_9ACTN|nr:hypothetical protein [Yinghuangia soli]MCF2528398.1 hypothetical protein [Yinghuangia soli]
MLKYPEYRAYGWRCTEQVDAIGNDVQDVCEWTYPDTPMTNRLENFFDAYTWECWRSTRILGPIDFPAYCRAMGYVGADRNGDHAYAWSCTGGVGINTQHACALLYETTPVVSRFQNFFDANSWSCRA